MILVRIVLKREWSGKSKGTLLMVDPLRSKYLIGKGIASLVSSSSTKKGVK